ncbi:hypothetical protein Efla_001842 [Eimeria flavescens]
MQSPRPLLAARVFSRRCDRKTRNPPATGSSSSSKQQQQQQQTAAVEEFDSVAQETPISPAHALSSALEAHASARLHAGHRRRRRSSSSSKDSSSRSACEADGLDRETTADSEVSAHLLSHALEEEAAAAAAPSAAVATGTTDKQTGSAPAATAASAATAAAAAGGIRGWRVGGWLAGAKRKLLPSSRLNKGLLVLLLLQQLLLLGLVAQRQQLQQQQEDLQQEAVYMQWLYEHKQQRLLDSRRARVGLKQQQQQQQVEYCRCRPCARTKPKSELIDLSDRFKHTNRDIELSVAAMLRLPCRLAGRLPLFWVYEQPPFHVHAPQREAN